MSKPTVTQPQLMFGCDLFLVYEPDPASSDPPITADLRWIQVTHAGGRSSTEFAQRGNPYSFPGGLTSVYGKPACSYYGGEGGVGIKTISADGGPTSSDLITAETLVVLDSQRQDHASKGIIDILAASNGAGKCDRLSHHEHVPRKRLTAQPPGPRPWPCLRSRPGSPGLP